MDTDAASTEVVSTQQEATAGKTGRSPPIILTTPTNLVQLQKQLKDVVAETFEFRNTRNGTRVLTKSLADFQSVKSYFDQRYLSYFSFFPKSEKPIKAVIHHLPINTPAEDISDGLVSLGFNIISVKQMTTTHRPAPDEPTSINLPLFLMTLSRSEKSQEIFQLPILCHIAIKVRCTEPGMASPSAITFSSSAMSELTASRFHAVYGAGVVTYIRSAPRRTMHPPPPPAVTAIWWKEKNLIPPIISDTATPRRSCRRSGRRRSPRPQQGGCSLPPSPLQVCPLQQHSEVANSNTSSLWHLRPRS
jgi:hypothetical protein